MNHLISLTRTQLKTTLSIVLRNNDLIFKNELTVIIRPSSSFEPAVVCSVSVIPLPTQKLFCFHVFYQAGHGLYLEVYGLGHYNG